MGKHDKHIEASSEEFLKNKIVRLEKENGELKDKLIFANDTIKKLQEQCSRMSKWASEIEASAQDRLEEKDARIKNLERAMSRMAEEIYGL